MQQLALVPGFFYIEASQLDEYILHHSDNAPLRYFSTSTQRTLTVEELCNSMPHHTPAKFLDKIARLHHTANMGFRAAQAVVSLPSVEERLGTEAMQALHDKLKAAATLFKKQILQKQLGYLLAFDKRATRATYSEFLEVIAQAKGDRKAMLLSAFHAFLAGDISHYESPESQRTLHQRIHALLPHWEKELSAQGEAQAR